MNIFTPPGHERPKQPAHEVHERVLARQAERYAAAHSLQMAVRQQFPEAFQAAPQAYIDREFQGIVENYGETVEHPLDDREPTAALSNPLFAAREMVSRAVAPEEGQATDV